MLKLAITLATFCSSLTLHATSVMPQELEKLSKIKVKVEARYPEFKERVLEMIENLHSLERFATRELRELKSDIDISEEQKVNGFISDIIALISQPKIKDDETTLKEIRAFYSLPSTISGKAFSTSCEKEKKEKVIDVVVRTSLPITRLMHAHSNATSTMIEQLNTLHTCHATYVSKGSLIAPDPKGIPILNMIPAVKNSIRNACILFWWGERMVVENFLKTDAKNVSDFVQWKRETDDWNGTPQKADPDNKSSDEKFEELTGVSSKLRMQVFKTSMAVFKHQLTGFYINGWTLHDLCFVLPKLKPLFVAYGKKIEQPLVETFLPPLLSVEARVNQYDKMRGSSSKGVFSYTDTTNMLNALDAFFEKGHAMKREKLIQDAAGQVDELALSFSWEKYVQEKEADAARTSSNIFVQGAIEEKKHRFEKFEPESIITTNTEGQQRAQLIKVLLADAHISSHLMGSSLYQALLHYDFITKTFDILDDSWRESLRSKVSSTHMDRVKGLFRKSYCALHDSYTLIMDHLFLFYERYPLPNQNNSTDRA
ncbi:MAG: hypothetical protein K2X53_00655 [Alphaproteobacteria bacterium]|nr:hypothetical protein [Alphaproteobacteria bacterium]